jgi:hypothetical protein
MERGWIAVWDGHVAGWRVRFVTEGRWAQLLRVCYCHHGGFSCYGRYGVFELDSAVSG